MDVFKRNVDILCFVLKNILWDQAAPQKATINKLALFFSLYR